LREHFGDCRALEITFRAIEAYITNRRADEKSNATINRELASGPASRPRPAAAAVHPEGEAAAPGTMAKGRAVPR